MQILSKQYKIEKVQNNEFSDLTIGRVNTKTGIIYIDESLNQDIKDETLLHEVLHVIDDNLKLNLSEEQIIRLSTGLYCILKENNIKINFS